MDVEYFGAGTSSDWNTTLPYDTDEGRLLLGDIVCILKKLIEEKICTGGLGRCFIEKVENYLNLKYPIPLEVRIFLSRGLYFLIVKKDVELSILEDLSRICQKLIKDRELFPPGSLILEWRPLYEVLKRVLVRKARECSPIGYRLNFAFRFVHEAKAFFPPEATKEILEEFLPQINVHDYKSSFNSIVLLGNFLPTTDPLKVVRNPDSGPQFYWVPTLFTLVSYFASSSSYSLTILKPLSYLAEDLSHSPHLIPITVENIRYIFSCGLRLLNLHIGSNTLGKTSNSSQDRIQLGSQTSPPIKSPDYGDFSANINIFEKKRVTPAFARFVIWSLYEKPSGSSNEAAPDIPQYEVIDFLDQFFQVIGIYFNPSNYGEWSISMSKLVVHLTRNLLIRIKKESSPKCITPNHYKLSPNLIRRLIDILCPILKNSLLIRNDFISNNTAHAMKNLCFIDPDTIIPKFMHTITDSFKLSQDKPYVINNCTKVLSHLVYPMMKCQKINLWIDYLPPCLEMSLFGININDHMRTISTLSFIKSFLMCVPIVDISRYLGDQNNQDGSPDKDLSLAVSFTSIFDTWALNLVEIIFEMIRNISSSHGEIQKNTIEYGLMFLSFFILENLFQQLSPVIEETITKRIFELTNSAIPSITKHMGVIFTLVSTPEKRIKVFSKRSFDIVLEELNMGAAQEESKTSSFTPLSESLTDSRFYWHLSIFANIFHHSGEHSLPYIDMIRKLLQKTLSKVRTRKGVKYVGNMLWVVIASLSSVYPTEYKSQPMQLWQNPDFFKEIYKHWGKSMPIKDSNLNWHIPTEKEMTVAIELLTEKIDQATSKLNEFVSNFNPNTIDSNEIIKWIRISRICIRASFFIVTPEDDNSTNSSLDKHYKILKDNLYYVKTRVINNGQVLDSNSPGNLLIKEKVQKVIRILLEISKKFIESDVDHVFLLSELVKCLGSCFCNKSISANSCKMNIYGYKHIKTEIMELEHGKKLLRYLIAKRAHSLHLSRLAYNFSQRNLIDGDEVITHMVNWAICRYSEVHAVAQKYLRYAIENFGSRLTGAIIEKVLYAIDNLFLELRSETSRAQDSDAKNGLSDGMLNKIKAVIGVFNLDLIRGFNHLGWDLRLKALVGLLTLYKQDLEASIKMNCYNVIAEMFDKIDWSDSRERYINLKQLYDDNMLKDLLSCSELSYSTDCITKIGVANGSLVPLEEEYVAIIEKILEYTTVEDSTWVVQTIAIEFLLLFLRIDQYIPERVITMSLDIVRSDVQTIRTLGLKLLVRIICILRHRVRCIKPIRKDIIEPSKDLIDGCTDISNADQNTVFLDNCAHGWLCWPKKCKLRYHGNGIDFDELLKIDKSTGRNLELLDKELSNKDFWDKFIQLFAQEDEKPQLKRTEGYSLIFFNFLFSLTGSRYVDVIRSSIEKFQGSTNTGEQRLYSQFIGGILRGSKYWSKSELDSMWSWVIRDMKNEMLTCSRESLNNWAKNCIIFPMKSRDPKRVYPLIESTVNEDIKTDPSSAYIEAQKIMLIRLVFSGESSWRLVNYRSELLKKFSQMFSIPYEIMGNSIGATVSTLSQIEFRPGIINVDGVLSESIIMQNEIQSMKYDTYTSKMDFFKTDTALEKCTEKVLKYLAFNRKNEQEVYFRIGKTICSWLTDGLSYYRCAGLYPILKIFLKELFLMLTCSNVNLQASAQIISNSLPYVVHNTKMLNDSMEILLDTLSDDDKDEDTWKMRLKLLPLLQVLVFNHLFIFTEEMSDRMFKVINNLLINQHTEIRHLAAVTLSGLVLCLRQDKIPLLAEEFEKKLKENPIPRSKRVCETKNDLRKTPQDLIVRVHGAVLGLCALVNAHPYSVRPWTPKILTTLAAYADSPYPIFASITQLFRDFKQTHQTTWEDDIKKFPEAELSEINGVLCSQCYYA